MNAQDRVIAAVVDRRSELGWTQRQLAAAAGVAERTVQNLEAGRRPQPLIRTKIEKALGWEPGEMRRIAEREEEPDVLPEGLRDAIREAIPDSRRAAVVERLVEAALLEGGSPPRRRRAAPLPARLPPGSART